MAAIMTAIRAIKKIFFEFSIAPLGVVKTTPLYAFIHTKFLTRRSPPPLVLALQDAGVLVSHSQHAAHHRSPYNNYCIVSGVWKEFLDEHKVFEALEMIVFFKLGVQPRSWSEPNSEWTEENETPSQTTLH
ncbi:fatty acid desaturase A [Actinidia rufa]|uniref:Fatty acid desaturase A n=1 Tax=Actinidia rufa TaxID=165716 RepID=A0A7J0G2B7_9ERIC|nr:fatty acid desaturase A [Actinidia rufa]